MFTVKHQTQYDVHTFSCGDSQKPSTSDCSPNWPMLAYRSIRIGLGSVFVWSGFTKLMDPQSFAVIIEAYGLIPEAAILYVAYGLSIAELLGGLGLMCELQWSLGLITGLLILFMMILGYGLWMGLDVDCGCFGPEDPEAHAYHSLRPALYRDMVMLAGIAYLFYRRRRDSISPLKLTTMYENIIKRR